MQLSRGQVQQILKKSKTQIRLPAKTATRFQVDRSYPVRSTGPEMIRCRVICREFTSVELGAITYRDALAEGHQTVDGFREWWVRRYDRRWLEIHEDTEILERFSAYHACRPVLRMRFALDPAVPPRFLMVLGARGGDELGYTSNAGRAVRDEGECVDESFQKWISADAHDRAQGLPGRREEAFRREAGQLSRRLKQSVRVVDATDLEVVAQLERIRVEVARLENMRGRKAA